MGEVSGGPTLDQSECGPDPAKSGCKVPLVFGSSRYTGRSVAYTSA